MDEIFVASQLIELLLTLSLDKSEARYDSQNYEPSIKDNFNPFAVPASRPVLLPPISPLKASYFDSQQSVFQNSKTYANHYSSMNVSYSPVEFSGTHNDTG